MPTQDWKPVRKGNTYCSPSCGGSCTRTEYVRAMRQATKLAATMGPGWTTHVWENLGWHYRVTSPDEIWSVYGPSDPKHPFYWIDFGNATTGQVATAHGATLKEALTNLNGILSNKFHNLMRIASAIYGTLRQRLATRD